MVKRLSEYITVDPKVRFGKPVIAGTRVPVDLILGKLASGMMPDEVMKEYDLSQDQLQAALAYATDIVSSEDVSMV